MKKGIIFLAATIQLALYGCTNKMEVTVSNPCDCDRLQEMVEITKQSVNEKLGLSQDETFVVTNGRKEVPYQITWDGKVIFPVTLAANDSQTFKIRKGTPAEVVTKVCGKHYPERVDDICWESDLAGFRVYGFKEDLPSGYDLFTKRNTDLPVIDQMYKTALDPEKRKIRAELEKVDKDSADRYNCDHMSFHVDHGFGADCYGVGQTLGAGVAALLDGEKIVYPFSFETYEILENGPLRFTLQLTFRPFSVAGHKNIIETRVLSVDLGSYFTKTQVFYTNLDCPMPIVTGIVVQDKDEKSVGDAQKGYIAYPAPTINADRQRQVDNGTIFLGHAFPFELEKTGITYFSDEESKAKGGSKGHNLAHSVYTPGMPFVYYWGFGWNHSTFESYEQWIEHLEKFSAQIKNPISVSIN